MTASSFGCQPSTDSPATSTGHIWWLGVHCYQSVDMELAAKMLTCYLCNNRLHLMLCTAVWPRKSISESTIQPQLLNERHLDTSWLCVYINVSGSQLNW